METAGYVHYVIYFKNTRINTNNAKDSDLITKPPLQFYMP